MVPFFLLFARTPSTYMLNEWIGPLSELFIASSWYLSSTTQINI